jgi:hypothetical protein
MDNIIKPFYGGLRSRKNNLLNTNSACEIGVNNSLLKSTHDVVLLDAVVTPVPGLLDLVPSPVGRRLGLVLANGRVSDLVDLGVVAVARLLDDRRVVRNVRVNPNLR